MSKRARPFRSRWSKLGNARIIITAFQTADEGNRTTLLLQAREALILAQGGARDDDTLSRLGNAVDYALILAEGAGNNAAHIEQIQLGQDAVMYLRTKHVAYLPDIQRALDILDALFAVCTPLQIGKARQEWWKRVEAGLVLECA